MGNCIPIQSPSEPFDRELLRQRFTYLGRGLQSFAFASEDGTVVLKLFINTPKRRVFWLSLLPIFPSWRDLMIEKCEAKWEKMFASYRLAYDELKEETALLALHDHISDDIRQTVTIVDKLGIAHTLNLDLVGFALQKRITPLYPALASLLEKNDTAGAKEAIHSLFELLLKRFEKGIADNDPLLRTNFGYVGNQATMIDIGPFSKLPKKLDPAAFEKELLRITASLKNWLSEKAPSLLPWIEQEIATTLRIYENS